MIDGTTQTVSTGDSNPQGPEVVLNGSQSTPGVALRLHGSQGVVR